MSWERYLEEYPNTDVKTFSEPTEFKSPKKDKRITPKGPGSLDKLITRSRSASKEFGAKAEANIQQMRESWMGVKPVGARALQILTPSRDTRPSTTQQLQRHGMTKSRRLVEARRSWQKQTQDQKIDSLSTEPNPGNTSPWKQENPIVPGSNADAGKWTGSDEMWKDSKESLEKGEKAWITPKKKPPEKDTKPTETKAQSNARISKGLSTLASALGDQSVKTHTVRVGEIDENPFSGYIG